VYLPIILPQSCRKSTGREERKEYFVPPRHNDPKKNLFGMYKGNLVVVVAPLCLISKRRFFYHYPVDNRQDTKAQRINIPVSR